MTIQNDNKNIDEVGSTFSYDENSFLRVNNQLDRPKLHVLNISNKE